MQLSVATFVERNLLGQFISNLERSKAAYKVAQDIAQYAKDSMHQGFGTPSMPGTPPNIQTGELHSSIVAVDYGKGHAEVQANADYAAELEFGTAHIAARPFLGPAISAITNDSEKKIANIVKAELGVNE